MNIYRCRRKRGKRENLYTKLPEPEIKALPGSGELIQEMLPYMRGEVNPDSSALHHWNIRYRMEVNP